MEDFIKSKIGAIALSALLAFGLMATIVYFTRGENKIHIYLPAVLGFGLHRYLRKDQNNNINLDEMNFGEKEINEELEDSKFQKYGVANLQEIIKNEWSEEIDHIRLGITRRVDLFESNEESNQGIEYTSIEYLLKIKLYYEGDDGYEDDYETPGLVIVDIMLNDSNGAILSSSEREGLVFCNPKSEESYFFDEFEELFNSDIKYFGDHLIAEFNNAINDFGKAWGNPSDDQNDKIELEELFDFKKILIRLQEYQAKKKV